MVRETKLGTNLAALASTVVCSRRCKEVRCSSLSWVVGGPTSHTCRRPARGDPDAEGLGGLASLRPARSGLHSGQMATARMSSFPFSLECPGEAGDEELQAL